MTSADGTFDLVAIGAGPAGHAAAVRVAELGGRAAIVEDAQIGGNCVNHCCIPTTTLLDTAEGLRRAQTLAFAGIIADPDLPALNRAVARKQQLVAALAAGIRAQLRTRRVELVQGRARVEGPDCVRVQLAEGGKRTLRCRNVLVATGARPEMPAIPGLADGELLWIDGLLRLSQAPRSLLVVGDGPCGVVFALEAAQLFAGFGTQTTLVYSGEALLPDGEAQLLDVLGEMLRAADVRVLSNARVEAVRDAEHGGVAVVRVGAETHTVPAEVVAAPDSRRPYWGDAGLEQLGVEARDGAIFVDEQGQTNVPGIWAAGDVTGGAMFSHRAAHAGRVVGEAVMGLPSARDERFLPLVLSTDPEYAGVGLSEEAARAAGYAVRTGIASLTTNARAITMGQREGLVKIVAEAGTGRLLGAHLLAPQAGELIGQAVVALRLGGSAADLAALTYWHPTLSEAIAEAARRASA
jgi:pyruvate/2-oxoglutarate dehydrogenase complex dihydrolipoamide dehydrogenase (E3) component